MYIYYIQSISYKYNYYIERQQFTKNNYTNYNCIDKSVPNQ